MNKVARRTEVRVRVKGRKDGANGTKIGTQYTKQEWNTKMKEKKVRNTQKRGLRIRRGKVVKGIEAAENGKEKKQEAGGKRGIPQTRKSLRIPKKKVKGGEDMKTKGKEQK